MNPADAQKDAGVAGIGAPTTMINTSGIQVNVAPTNDVDPNAAARQ